MTYPIRSPRSKVDPDGTLTVPFRPAAAGLVNVIVVATGIQPPPPDGGPQPGQSPTYTSFSVALRVEIFKPGAAAAVGSKQGFVNVTGPDVPNRVVLAVQATAVAADLGADWTVRVTNAASVSPQASFTLASAECDVTVRYQVVAGNLGKVDHIVVLMMENRSFDHMLGYLSLPAGAGGAGRTDVDGLKGDEFNFDSGGQPHRVFHRGAPLPGQSTTSFLNDPGHGWSEVVEQLGGDDPLTLQNVDTTQWPLHTANGGFVRNFEKHLAADARQLPPLMTRIEDVGKLAGGNSRTVSFRPVLPGRIGVVSLAADPPRSSESGYLAHFKLTRPGSATPIAAVEVPIGSKSVSFGYLATAADLQAPGDWTCEIRNDADADVTFTTDVIFVQAPHDTSTQERPGAVMGYYTGAEVPAYDTLASQFTICDRWFASLPTDTWPNRLYAHTGGAGGLLETPATRSVEINPPGYALTTIFEVLQAQHLDDWEIFFSDLPFALIFEKLAQDATYTAHMRSISDLLEHAETGDLPAFSWVDPNFNDVPDDKNAASDDHPPGDVSRGQRLVAQLYNALSQGPAWSKTLLIITYDEHGGFFDHVLPPGNRKPPVGIAGPPDDDPHLHVYGLRVPTFLVSPWAPKSVSKLVYDHTSLLSTVLHRFCATATPTMGKREAAAKHVGPALSAASPNLKPKAAPLQPATAVHGTVIDRNTFGVDLHTALFRF